MSVVREICTNVAIMSSGKVIETGSVADVFAHPKEQITKELLKGDTGNEKFQEKDLTLLTAMALKSELEKSSRELEEKMRKEREESYKVNTEKVKSFVSLFEGCENLEHIRMTEINTRNVEDMSYMFKDCNKLTSLNVKNNKDFVLNTIMSLINEGKYKEYVSSLSSNYDSLRLLKQFNPFSPETYLNPLDFPAQTLGMNRLAKRTVRLSEIKENISSIDDLTSSLAAAFIADQVNGAVSTENIIANMKKTAKKSN